VRAHFLSGCDGGRVFLGSERAAPQPTRDVMRPN
jgi:hypothetical protein